MKKILMTVLLFASFNVQAEVKHKIENLNRINFDSKTLEVEYQIGGGCESHTTEIELVAVPTESKNIANLRVDIYDVTPKEDFCEALLYQTASVNLQVKLKELLKADPNNDIYYAELLLPKVRLNPASLLPF